MQFLARIIENNRRWAEELERRDRAYFKRLAAGQQPECLWIGCADSRVPPTQITGLGPGELFMHRNVANVVSPTDTNLLAVLQFAVDVLKVDHVVVCGHYGCGGVKAVLEQMPDPPLGAWLHEVWNVRRAHETELAAIDDPDARWRRLCELNVIAQIETLSATWTVRKAWERGQDMVLHGLMFDLETGRLSNMNVSRFGPAHSG